MRLVAVGFALTLAACTARSDSDERIGTNAQPIINGIVSTPDQNFVVQLGMAPNGEYFGACSAIMVAKNLVLTARHCVGQFKDETSWAMSDFPADALEVYYGADAPSRSATRTSPNAKGTKLFVPPTDQMMPDIALVLLDRPIATAPIARIRLDGGAKKDELLDIVGFGIDESSRDPSVRMQRKGVPVIDVGPRMTAQHELFAGEFIFGEAACSGDSGGPALSATTHAVVGVASRVSNGVEPTDEDPAAFCVGTATEDVYTSLAPVKDVVLRAFAAAGAQPFLEGAPDPTPEAEAPPVKATPRTEPKEEEDDAPAPAKRTTPKTATSGGCNIGALRSERPSGIVFVTALSALVFALRTKRERQPRRPRA